MEITKTDNFHDQLTKRIGTFILTARDLSRFLANNGKKISDPEIATMTSGLERELELFLDNYQRGYKERLSFLLPTQPLLERKIGRFLHALDKLRQLADQDYYEYTAADVAELYRLVAGKLKEFRQKFELGKKLDGFKG